MLKERKSQVALSDLTKRQARKLYLQKSDLATTEHLIKTTEQAEVLNANSV
ncbi:MAG: hypothetical protein LBL41_05495 [Bifidobacteriaceae bacterium]|jgi:hypothetical protein|nr:hypothetical protein [Bifidobacteriaceae bacterium]